MILIASIIVLTIWLALFLAPGRFWQIEQYSHPIEPEVFPSVAAVIPAHNEAPRIGETLCSLWRQQYPGQLSIFVVNDRSIDGTAEAASAAAQNAGRSGDPIVIDGAPLPPGWVGKVWAMHQGLERALATDAAFILFSDADISHGDHTLRELVSQGVSGSYDLVSLMVRLRCSSAAEKLMIPAFVFFFRMLYPFRRVNDPKDTLAGAAGGTMLVRRDAFERIGGMAAIKGALIDDCHLAREIKRGGHPIWLGLSETSSSTRGYGSLAEIVRMISRTAYTQLDNSLLRLFGCVLGLAVTFLMPPTLTIFTRGWPSLVAGATWIIMSALYAPMLLFYRRSLLWAPLLPFTATVYLWATVLSAWKYHRGRRGEW